MSRELRVGDQVTRVLEGVVLDASGQYNETPTVKVRWRGPRFEGTWEFVADVTLMLPQEPPVGSVVLYGGRAYTRFKSHGKAHWGAFGVDDNEGSLSWEAIDSGEVLFSAPEEAS